LPTIFDCQPDRQRSHSKRGRPGILKRHKIESLNEILQTKSVDEACVYIDEPVTEEPLYMPDVNIGNYSGTDNFFLYFIYS